MVVAVPPAYYMVETCDNVEARRKLFEHVQYQQGLVRVRLERLELRFALASRRRGQRRIAGRVEHAAEARCEDMVDCGCIGTFVCNETHQRVVKSGEYYGRGGLMSL